MFLLPFHPPFTLFFPLFSFSFSLSLIGTSSYQITVSLSLAKEAKATGKPLDSGVVFMGLQPTRVLLVVWFNPDAPRIALVHFASF